MVIRFRPVGIADISDPNVTILPHEIVEKFIFDNWNASVLAKNQIKFGYNIKQNVSTTAKNALKCFYGGSETTSLENNDTSTREIAIVNVILESRHINNFADDTPADLMKMRTVVRDVINGNRLALQPQGIYVMTFVDSNEVTQDETNDYIYKMRLQVRCLQIFEKIDV